MASIPTIYGTAGSTCTGKILLPVLETGKVQDKDWALSTVTDFSTIKQEPWLSTRQPFGKIPAYEDKDVSFYESRAIARYLVEKLAGAESPLLPQNLKEKAFFEQWASLEYGTYAPPLETIAFHRVFYKYKGTTPDENAVKEALEKLKVPFEVLEKQLTKSDYIALNRLTLVDYFLVPVFELFVLQPEGKEVLVTYPHIGKWWDRILNSTGYKQWTKLKSH